MQPCNTASPISVTLFGKSIDLNFVQFLNAYAPIRFTPSSITTSSNKLLLEKASESICSTVPGIITFFKFVTPEKAPAPIFLIEGGITTVSLSSTNSKFLFDESNVPSTTSHELTRIPIEEATLCSVLFVVFKYIFPFTISIFSIYFLLTLPNTASIPFLLSSFFVL